MTLVQPLDPAMPEVLTWDILEVKIPFLFVGLFKLPLSWNQKLSNAYRSIYISSRTGWSWVQGGPQLLSSHRCQAQQSRQ